MIRTFLKIADADLVEMRLEDVHGTGNKLRQSGRLVPVMRLRKRHRTDSPETQGKGNNTRDQGLNVSVRDGCFFYVIKAGEGERDSGDTGKLGEGGTGSFVKGAGWPDEVVDIIKLDGGPGADVGESG